MRDFLIELCLLLPTVVIALTLHEYAHAQVAYWQGDKTPDRCGRLTLNPIKHLDPIGAVCLLFFHFGWAKPVPICPEKFKRPRLGVALTSIAGPLANVLLAFISSFFYILTIKIHITTPAGTFMEQLVRAWGLFNKYFSIINLNLAIFNLLPIPPLDGSKILYSVMPERAVMTIERYQVFISIGFLIILFLDNRFLGGNITYGMSYLSNKLFSIFTTPFYHMFF